MHVTGKDGPRRRPGPVGRVELLKRFALGLPHEAETAIRGWARTDDVVAAAQLRVDQRRGEARREVLAPLVGDEQLTATLAELGLSLLVGHQQLHHDGRPIGLEALFDQFELLIPSHVVEAFTARVSAPDA